MQFRNISPLQLPGGEIHAGEPNQAAHSTFDFAVTVFQGCTLGSSYSVPFLSFCLRPHLISLSLRDQDPVFLKDLSFFMNQVTRKEGLNAVP